MARQVGFKDESMRARAQSCVWRPGPVRDRLLSSPSGPLSRTINTSEGASLGVAGRGQCVHEFTPGRFTFVVKEACNGPGWSTAPTRGACRTVQAGLCVGDTQTFGGPGPSPLPDLGDEPVVFSQQGEVPHG